MLNSFRTFFKSKFGLAFVLAFLGLIAVAFAASDVANTGMFGGVAGGDRVAVVGDRRISTSDLTQNANNALQQMREQNPTLSMQGFVAQGGFDEVVDQMISRSALAEFATMLGLRAGDRLVNSEIDRGSNFRNAEGEFDREAFLAAIAQRNLTEATVREDLALSLLARQSVVPISFQTPMPESFAQTYALLLRETRLGNAAAIPAGAFAPEDDPTDEQIQAFYEENRTNYIRPERRVIRYAAFDETALGDLPPVTDAQIAARYEADAVLYRETERRSFTQLVLPTQAAAQAVIDEVNGGMSLEESAASKSLATTTVDDVEQPDLATTTSEAVAAAGFDAAEGTLAGPANGQLGWYVLRVNDVTEVAARSLADASDEIRETLEAERRTLALNELTERLDREFQRGRTLEEAAEELDIEIQSTPQLLANGQVYGQTGEPPQELARIVNFAFDLEERQPQIAELIPGTAFMIYDVGDIAPSAVAPLAEIRDDVARQWRRDIAMEGASEAAARILERVEGGMALADAVAEEEVDLPRLSELNLNRQQLAQSGQVNRATILFFSMAEGTTKSVVVDELSTWFVVELNEIQTPDLAELEDGEAFVTETAQQLSGTLGDEYAQQYVAAAEAAVDIERNEDGIEAVRAVLTGDTNRRSPRRRTPSPGRERRGRRSEER